MEKHQDLQKKGSCWKDIVGKKFISSSREWTVGLARNVWLKRANEKNSWKPDINFWFDALKYKMSFDKIKERNLINSVLKED